MLDFWMLSALLALIACLCVLVPFLRYTKHSESQQEENDFRQQVEKQNVASYQEKLNDLKAELEAQLITSQEFEVRKKELEIALLNDVSVDPKVESSSIKNEHIDAPKSSVFVRILVISSLLVLVLGSYWLYSVNGFHHQVKQYTAMNFDQKELDKAKELAQQGDMSALLKQLHDKLKAAPDNMEGWQLLASSAMNVQAYALALEAYQQIIRIMERQNLNPAPVYGLLAQSHYYLAGGKMSPAAKQAVDQAVKLDENEINALGLLAIDAFSTNRLSEARSLWQKILVIYPEHPARASIEAGIQRVSAVLGDSGSTQDLQVMAKTQVQVTVSIDPSLNQKALPEDTVFIIAKQVVGDVQNAAIPLAVSRHQVKDLPITVMLDDSKAMAPIAKLSMAEKYMVIARISKTGSPTSQVGDFEAVSADLSRGEPAKIELMIQSELK